MSTLEEPDKGYAWVVLFGACVINGILSGMARMIGLLYVTVIDAYGVTRQQASLPFTVRNAVRYLAGPLTGVLGQTYGIRSVTFWGGLVAALGSIACAFAPTVDWIVIYWGIVHGLGFALANTLFAVAINQYFERHRATASGIVLSGACVAALLFPFMIDALLDEYGPSGCFLLLGGLFLHVMPFSLVLSEPPWVKNPDAYAKQRSLLLNRSTDEKPEKCDYSPDPGKFYFEKPKLEGPHAFETMKIDGPAVRRTRDVCDRHVVTCTLYRSMDFDRASQQEKEAKSQFQKGHDNLAYVPDSNETRTEVVNGQATRVTSSQPKKPCSILFKNIREVPRLYLNPIYVLISLSMAAYFSSFLPIVAVIVDYSRDKGIPTNNEKFLIYIFTVGDMIGRLGFGWITDRKYVSFPNFMMLTFMFKGAFLVLLTMSNSVIINMVVLGLYGCTAGIAFNCFPLLVHRYVEQENQTLGIGCIGLFTSVANFGIPPLIGHFRDHVGSYDGLFYIVAVISVFTGALWLLVPLYEKMQEKHKKPTQI